MSDSEKQEPDKDEAPELIIDSDWKEQVAKEKEAAAGKEPAKETAAEPPSESAASSEPSASFGKDDADLQGDMEGQHAPPPASFEVLVSMLFTQAMASLGQMPDPETNEPKVDKPFAKHFIDTLDVLQEKTSGNLNDQEKKLLSEALHALRMTYVNVKG